MRAFLVLIIILSSSLIFPDDTVTVTRVIDGDTIDVRFADGSEDRVRLVGIDCPEGDWIVDGLLYLSTWSHSAINNLIDYLLLLSYTPGLWF